MKAYKIPVRIWPGDNCPGNNCPCNNVLLTFVKIFTNQKLEIGNQSVVIQVCRNPATIYTGCICPLINCPSNLFAGDICSGGSNDLDQTWHAGLEEYLAGYFTTILRTITPVTFVWLIFGHNPGVLVTDQCYRYKISFGPKIFLKILFLIIP